MQPILDFIKQLWQAFVDSGLAKDCADVFMETISFNSEKLLWLMWDFYNKFFGG